VRVTWLTVAVIVAMGVGALAGPVSDDDPPLEPGLHQLEFEFEHDGETEPRRYGVYLPPEVKSALSADGRKLPLVVFLYGTGSRGLDERGLQAEGPLAAARGHASFRKSIDYAILVPQIDRRERYENARSGAFIAEATRRAIKRWPIDPDRVYLVGMSMGGGGVWYAGLAAPELYAAAASFAGHAHKEPAKVAAALKDKPIFITVGSVDGRFFKGSQRMAAAFEEVDADLTYFTIAGRGHNVWNSYLGREAFFDWLLKHRRGGPPPKDRASGEEMLNWALNPPGDPKYHAFVKRMKEEFAEFAPWWHLEHCGMVEGAGLREERLGREGVFVTHPLNGRVPCRIMITAKIPEGERTTLHVEAGHAEDERWRLRVYVDGRQRLKTVVGKGKGGGEKNEEEVAADGEADVEAEGEDRGEEARGAGLWHEYEVDMTDDAGEEVFVEILSEGEGRGDARATWGRIELVSEPLDASPEHSDGTSGASSGASARD